MKATAKIMAAMNAAQAVIGMTSLPAGIELLLLLLVVVVVVLLLPLVLGGSVA
jgi:hypothetical protein